MTRPDHYAALGVSKDASAADIIRAYRRAARAAHPDRGGSHERMQEINAAKDVLTDPERRARYDAGESDVRPGGLSPFEAEVQRAIRELFSEAITNNVLNPLESAIGGLKNGKAAAKAGIDLHKMAIRRLEKQRRRVIAVGERNLYEDILESALSGSCEKIEQYENTVRVADRAIEILNNEYRPGEIDDEELQARWNAMRPDPDLRIGHAGFKFDPRKIF